MPIKPICDSCQEELDEFGAILLSPPSADGRVRKLHLCVKCYNEIIERHKINQSNENTIC